jgi:hypothetical protein
VGRAAKAVVAKAAEKIDNFLEGKKNSAFVTHM